MTDSTPTTADVRERYESPAWPVLAAAEARRAEFNRWLAEHDHQERERCAQAAGSGLFDGDDPPSSDEVAYNTARREAAAAIRALSNVVDPEAER